MSANQCSHLLFICRCTHIIDCQGEIKPFSEEDQDNIVKTVIETMANDGLRTICVAYKDFVQGKSLLDCYGYQRSTYNLYSNKDFVQGKSLLDCYGYQWSTYNLFQ